MQFKKYSPDTVAELFLYLADHEKFTSLAKLKEFSRADVSGIFREIAEQLLEHVKNVPAISKKSFRGNDIPDSLNKVIANLSPYEENILFKSFKIS